MIDCTFFEWAAAWLARAKTPAPTFSKFIFALPGAAQLFTFSFAGILPPDLLESWD